MPEPAVEPFEPTASAVAVAPVEEPAAAPLAEAPPEAEATPLEQPLAEDEVAGEATEAAPLAEPLGAEEAPIEAEPVVEAPEPIGAESLVGEPAVEVEPPTEPELPGQAPLEGSPTPTAEWEVAEEAAAVESPLSALSDMVSGEPEAPPPPSWDSLLARAQELADAQAAMLIGPDGALLAATDGWPAVGAAAIATKLLPMVAPKLANPGALVPVKLAGQILSVWRFEVEDQPVTAAMLAEKALPVIVRPDIDELFAQGTLRS